MEVGPIPVLAYIDPTGGLPPSAWAAILAPLLAAGGAALMAFLTFGRKFRPLFKRVLLFLLVAAIIIAGSVMAWSLLSKGGKVAGAPRVVVLGFDGLDPGLMRLYMDEGRLPNFSRLAGQGTFHELRTTCPPQSPVAWTSFITGTDPGAHGVFDFIRRDPDTYRPDLAIAGRKKVALPWTGKAFWSDKAIEQAGATILRVPLTFPPQRVNGRMLSGMGVWDARGTEGTYFFYSTGKLPEDSRGMVFALEESDGALRGAIPGPYRAGEEDKVREPFELAVSGEAAELRIQGQSHALREGAWSDWIAIEFRLGALQLQKVQTVTRVLWRRRGEDVTLYVSPLNFDPAAPLFDISHPKEYARELKDAIGPYHTRGMPFDTHAVNDGALSDEDFLAHWEGILAEREKMLAHELARFEGGLLVCYFEASDTVQHMYWWAMDESHPAHGLEGAARYADVIPKCYERFDAILGSVMEKVGKDATVVVLSDHGFGPFRKAVHLNTLLLDLGFLALEGNAEVSEEFLESVDWSNTKAYALGFNALYLNLAGREGKGCVAREDAAALLKDIAAKLEAYADAETGEHPISKAYLADEVYPECRSLMRPDIIVGYRRGYRASWQTALGGVPEGVLEVNRKKWSGDHCIDPAEVPGIFLSSDAALDAPSITDLGPAIVDYFRRAAAAKD